MLTWEYPPNIVGGLSRHVEGLAKGLCHLGYSVHIITTKLEELSPYEKDGNIEIYRVTPLNDKDLSFIHWVGGLNLAIIDQVNKLVKENHYLFIHAHDWLVGAAAITIKEAYKLPLITTIHATEHGRNQGIYTEMQKRIHEQEESLVKSSDKVIICSDFMKEEVKKVFGLDLHKIVMIPNGINTSFPDITYTKDVLSKFNIQSNKKMIFSIGRMVKEKGFYTLIEAAKIFENTRPDVYFIVAGKGPLLSEFRQTVLKLGLRNISFIGFVKETEREALFKECYLSVFPSLYEPFGIVALEAMINGKPTIVSNVGGLKGIINHLETGLLMKANCKESFIEQAGYLLDNEDLARVMGEKGKKLMEAKYSWRRIAVETEREYNETLLQLRS